MNQNYKNYNQDVEKTSEKLGAGPYSFILRETTHKLYHRMAKAQTGPESRVLLTILRTI